MPASAATLPTPAARCVPPPLHHRRRPPPPLASISPARTAPPSLAPGTVQGNITEAIFWSRKQLEMRREPETLRSLATMLVMRAEVEPGVVDEAMRLFDDVRVRVRVHGGGNSPGGRAGPGEQAPQRKECALDVRGVPRAPL